MDILRTLRSKLRPSRWHVGALLLAAMLAASPAFAQGEGGGEGGGGEIPPTFTPQTGWWWNPVKYHDKLLEEERLDVLRWFYAGGVGFMVIICGCVLLALGVLVAK